MKIAGPSYDPYGNKAYSSEYILKRAISERAIEVVAADTQRIEVYPPSGVVSVEYGVAICGGELYVVIFEYCSDQNATACTYGSFYTAVDTDKECKLVAYSGTRVVNGVEKRYVAVLDESENVYRVYDAPVFIEVKWSDRSAALPMGLGPIAIAIIAAVLGIAGVAAWGYMRHAEAEEKWANTVKTTVEACLNSGDYRCAVTALSAASGVRHEEESGGDIRRWLSTIVTGAGALIATIMLMVKLRVIVEFLRMILHRRG